MNLTLGSTVRWKSPGIGKQHAVPRQRESHLSDGLWTCLDVAEDAVVTKQSDQTRRRLGGRQPLCGTGVWSSTAVTRRPALVIPFTADSRPEPAPRIRISTSLMPILRAFCPAASPARVAANGVLLRAPLNPMVPAESQQRV